MGSLRFHSKITFTKANGDEFIFRNYFNGCEWKNSIEDLTDRFKLRFPKAGQWEGKKLFSGDAPVFEVGDKVLVQVGYYPDLFTVFQGWVSKIGSKIPVEIFCEDDMWQFKNTNITYPTKRQVYYYGKTPHGKIRKKPLKHPRVVSANITLRDLLEACLDTEEWDIDCPDVNLGQFRATNASLAKILEALRDKYGLYSRFIDGVLVVGFAYDATRTTTYKYVFNKTAPNAVIDDSGLEWQKSEDTSIKVVAKLMGLNNTFEEVTVGDTDGAQRSLHFYWDGKTLPKPDIKTLAEKELTNSRYDGFRGSFRTFGYYPIKAGDIVEFSDYLLPERDGSYLVKSVGGSVDMEGYRHDIELGNKIQ